jgi:hypothetical protein
VGIGALLCGIEGEVSLVGQATTEG